MQMFLSKGGLRFLKLAFISNLLWTNTFRQQKTPCKPSGLPGHFQAG